MDKHEWKVTGKWADEYAAVVDAVSIFPRGESEVPSNMGTQVQVNLALQYLIPALAGEVGELSSIFAKAIRDNDGYFTKGDEANIMKELGDILFMVVAILNSLGTSGDIALKQYDYTLPELAAINAAKLLSRQARGTIGGSGDNR